MKALVNISFTEITYLLVWRIAMRKTKIALIAAGCLFATAAVAQQYPEVVEDDDNFIIDIPYIEYEDADGETRALSAELVASKSSSEISFSLNESALMDVEVDAPAPISGDGACSRTTNAQYLSCKADVQDDYFEKQANCFNYSDSEEQQECFAEATEERLEGAEECDDIEEEHDNLCAIFGEDPYDPDLSALTFLTVDEIAANPNPFFPLVVGNTWVYEDDEEVITVTVLDQTREIEGIESIVVQDVVEEDGELIEDTFDWYAQDSDGNVWYMGELSRNYEDGELSDIDGSWEAGVEGAKAGILFRAMPVVGETLRQEYRIGEAEDIGQTLSITASESTASGYDCEGACLQTLEYTPIEPGEHENKFYKPGTGMILETKPDSEERLELVDFTPGS